MNNDINKSSMLRIGTILNGTYRIDGYLSSGGFGNTYIATDIEFDEQYAIKEFFMKGVSQRDGNNTTVSVSIEDNRSTFESQREKFKKEARRLRKLKNEHIVHVYRLFEENGTAYYVMDYVNGENLSERLKRTGVPLPEGEVLRILPQILDALDAAHNFHDPKDTNNKGGILHLDLKPANIMVDKQGVAKLIDFGASKQQSAKGGATTSSAISYTNGYAPREQMEQNLDKFGPWTDFYALGATLYALLTNRRPPLPSDIDDDETPDKRQSLPLPSTISDKTKRLVLWLMNTNRKKRPQSVDDIRNFLAGDDSVALIANDGSSNHGDDDEDEGETLLLGAGDDKGADDAPDGEGEESEDNPQPTATPIKNAEKSGSGKRMLIVVGVLVVAIIVFVVLTKGWGGDKSQSAGSAGSDKMVVDSVATTFVNQVKCKVKRGSCTYTGYVNEAGVPNGEGEAWLDDGRYYKGNYDNGMMVDDDAFFRFSNGDTYQGSFVNDHFSNGRYTIKQDQSYFEGAFDSKGQPKKGVWYNKNGEIIENV